MTRWNRWTKFLFVCSSLAMAAQSVELPASPYLDSSCSPRGAFLDQCRGIFLGAAAGAIAGYAAGRTRRGKRGAQGPGIFTDLINPLVVTFDQDLGNDDPSVQASETTFEIFLFDPFNLQAHIPLVEDTTTNPISLFNVPAQAPKVTGAWYVILRIINADPEQAGQLATVTFSTYEPVTIPSTPQTFTPGQVFVQEFLFPPV